MATIYEKIIAKGILDAERMIAAARERTAETIRTELEQAQTESQQQIRLAEQKASNHIKAARTDTAQKAKMISLEQRKAVLDGVFSDAERALSQITDLQFVELVTSLLRQDGLSGNELIESSAKDQKRFVALFSSSNNHDLDRLSRSLKLAQGPLRLAKEPAALEGGFRVIGRNFDIDHSWKSMLANLRERIEADIASILFSQGD